MKPSPLRDAPATPEPNLYLAWYEAWRAAEERKGAAEGAARARRGREIRLMAGLLIAWALLAGAAGGLALALWAGG